jgi:hypothetical protein
MTKRHQPVIQSHSDESSDHWMKRFENSLQKGAVQPRSQVSVFDQISSIMNNSKSKYTSVQNAVDNMMERSGLTAYVDGVKTSKEETTKKVAQQVPSQHATSIEPSVEPKDDKTPQVIQDKPDILKTLDNIINDSRGNMSISAIIGRLRSLHSNDIPRESEWDDERLLRLVSKMNLEAKKNNPSTFDNYSSLGTIDHSNADSEIDRSNVDAFFALQPAK